MSEELAKRILEIAEDYEQADLLPALAKVLESVTSDMGTYFEFPEACNRLDRIAAELIEINNS